MTVGGLPDPQCIADDTLFICAGNFTRNPVPYCQNLVLIGECHNEDSEYSDPGQSSSNDLTEP